MLLTLEEINDHYPDLYNNQSCLKCHTNIESTIHIFTCQHQLNYIKASICNILKDILQQHTTYDYTLEIINQKIRNSNLLKIDTLQLHSFKTTSQSNFLITDTLRFLILKSLTNTLI